MKQALAAFAKFSSEGWAAAMKPGSSILSPLPRARETSTWQAVGAAWCDCVPAAGATHSLGIRSARGLRGFGAT